MTVSTLEAPALGTNIVTRLADFSHYQELITLAFVKQHNLKGFAAKCTEGNYYVDSHYATNHSRARSYGLVFWAYHFMRPERCSGTAAADYFLSHAALKAGDRVLLDAEASALGQAATNQHIKDFAKRIIARSPLTGRDIYLSGGYCGNGTGKGVASYYEHIWYPAYHATGWPSSWNPGFSVAWENNTGFKPAPHVWQCDTTGGFDHDVSWLTVAQLAGGTTPVVEDDMQLSDKVKLNKWVMKQWPKDSGLQDGSITVQTALGSGYADARKAADNTDAILAKLEAQQVTIGKLVDAVAAGPGVDVNAVKQDIIDAINSIQVNVVANDDEDV